MRDSAARFHHLLDEWHCGYVTEMGFFAVLIDCLHDLDADSIMPEVPRPLRPSIWQSAMEMRAALRAGERLLSFTSNGERPPPRADVIEGLGRWLDQHADAWLRGRAFSR